LNSTALSVVIPAHDEQGHLHPHLGALVPVLEALAPDRWEVIIVDDGSTDLTSAEIGGLADGTRVRALRFEQNRGKGAAVRAGVLASRGDAILICDADMATPPDELSRFLGELGRGADLVLGDRRSPLALIGRRQPWHRRWLGRGYAALARRVVRAPIRDFNCGFKLLRGTVARELFGRIQSQRWAFDVELIALALREGRVIRNLPVRWNQGPRSNVAVVRDIVFTFWDLMVLWWRLRAAPEFHPTLPP